MKEIIRTQAQRSAPSDIPFQDLPVTPAYLIDEPGLISNLERLREFKAMSGAKVLLAQKAYSAFSTYPLVSQYLDGTCSSGLYEAKLAHEFMPEGEIEVFCPAYKDDEFLELFEIADTLIFNSFKQLERYRTWLRANKPAEEGPRLGLRINPEVSSVETDIYNPAGPKSRLGITFRNFVQGVEAFGLEGITGLHFHVLCEENADSLKLVWDSFRERFGAYLDQMDWLNMGGGHHITRADYDLDLAAEIVQEARRDFDLEVYMEPGEAIPLDAGYLVTDVIDTMYNEMPIALLDTSAVCHMPDVLEMPYRPRAFVWDAPPDGPEPYRLASESGEHLTRLGGPTCLAGDIVGDYDFGREIVAGDRLVFCDMAIYTMVKTNTFNGMPLPVIYLWDGHELKCVKQFGYEDFKMRLS